MMQREHFGRSARCLSASFRECGAAVALWSARRHQSQSSLGSSRDRQRGQPNADPNTGSQMSVVESPDLSPHIQFGLNNLEHVKLPDMSDEARRRGDIEKEREMRKKFGEYGPGERLTKSSQQTRRDMLEEQQDVDGLPWEVRWRKSLIPTSEEVLQDIRDRFDLYIQDPIEREQEWYLHWKDRSFKIQKDRMIWPQGYTDYLDHYDENGRRRVLPTDQRWSDSSWKHLADTRYKDRMWLIEGEERKAVHQSLQTDRVLLEEEEQRQSEVGDVYHGIVSGVVDLDPEQTYQALSGTADPLEVAKTKMKLQAYGAGQALLAGKQELDPSRVDPISGFPKADMEPLASGITVEQGAAIATQANIQYEMLEQGAEASRQAGHDPVVALMTAHHNTSKQYGDRPILHTQVEANVQKVKQLEEERKALEAGEVNRLLTVAERTVAQIEKSVLAESVAGAQAPAKEVREAGSKKGSVAATQAAAKKPSEDGFIHVAKRPKHAEPDLPNELYRVPQSKELDEMPKWYRETLVETEPLIREYDMVHDPLEKQQPKKEYYVPPPLRDSERVTLDDAPSGASAFDEVKMHKLKSLPELVAGYKPLPLFREVAKDGSIESAAKAEEEKADAQKQVDKNGTPLKKSERLRLERQERLRKSKLTYDSDILLPTLPWETDSIVDPYRGVEATSAVDFNKADLEKSWRAYRETFQQALTEFGNLTQVTSEDKCEKMLFDTMDRFRAGAVGDHPEIPKEQEEVFQLIFEAHTKHFLADFYKFKGNRTTEANTVKAEADEILRRASAKSKLLGQNFMNFVQEMTSLELDTIRKNPVQRYAVMVRDRKYESVSKPFMKWIKNVLGEFIVTEFQSLEQLETHREFLHRHLNDARVKCPSRVEGVSDAARDAAVEAFYQWCRGALAFYAGKHLQRMHIDFADTRFRSRAEELFEDSIELFSNYAKAGRDIVQIPIPDADPPYEYDEKEFLDGESAVFAEVSGHLDKAEALWHSGTTKRWYPMTDETEYMWFNERRGRLTLATDISDRCLENVNKKTHPSIHPFPERARVFLEGAPLTQETAEHLWLRYMGDLYWEHSEFMYRQGRFQTGRSYREKCLNLYHLAVRTARERLPTSWKAPLLTEAKYMLRVYEPNKHVERHLKDVETVVEKLFAEGEPRHWIEPFSELPYRLAVVHANLPAYGQWITKEVSRRLGWQPPNELLLRDMEQRARGGAVLPELLPYFRTVNEVAEVAFRRKVLQWRAKEHEGSDSFLFWTHLYFAFRVYPQNREEVQQMWDMYEPAYLYIYTQCALASRMRGHRLINDALRRVCQILLPGDAEQKATLLKELTKVREKMSHIVDRKELDRTINALEAHIQNPSQQAYTYGSSLLYRDAVLHEKVARNPLLRTQMAAKDYAELRKRQEELRVNGTTLNPQQAAQLQEQQGMAEDEPIGSQADPSTKDMFARQ
ncbi:hypothetical protein ABL78_6779 [Leptomonas seymouri]|uniref:Uncharacterized protein n=1 Tax=Leptomonas seymouri TaxID=5684 RepID=A0A0N1I1J4_LEPSE|nr:hypothetical protein ABL78_6779 [Leptomonas seymouri]|eukprot:KPI84173.1 hypothetical protein ABL78_6779 [Leptomonas seymouri]